MVSYNTSDFRKGLKVQIDGEPFLMVECNFVKPGKGQALYKTKLKHLIKNTVLDRTYKSGESLEGADVEDTEMQFLYQDGENYVFMDPTTFDQPTLTAEQVGDDAKWLKDGLMCMVTFYNGNPIAFAPPNHLVLRVEYTEPGARGNTATNVTKPATVETGAEVQVPIFIETGELIKVDTRTSSYIERAREDKK
ncbi:Elongation factor P [Planctomycetes bacterium Pan216]|uniref:Elongation factor P n=1 Tax=Kolteria novifilia TaxID=2527975 RepID=A0A518BCJ2_9BACT|nr:Elongation factor P [Planctomycetes bacterium Pan216]